MSFIGGRERKNAKLFKDREILLTQIYKYTSSAWFSNQIGVCFVISFICFCSKTICELVRTLKRIIYWEVSNLCNRNLSFLTLSFSLFLGVRMSNQNKEDGCPQKSHRSPLRSSRTVNWQYSLPGLLTSAHPFYQPCLNVFCLLLFQKIPFGVYFSLGKSIYQSSNNNQHAN